jgi:hypothetical protein
MKIVRLLGLAGLALSTGGALRPAAAEPCITIVIHEEARLGFRNACSVCKQAVWSWGGGQSYFSRDGKVEGVWQGGEAWTRKYRVPPHSEITVDEEWPTGKLLREDRCPTSKR